MVANPKNDPVTIVSRRHSIFFNLPPCTAPR